MAEPKEPTAEQRKHLTTLGKINDDYRRVTAEAAALQERRAKVYLAARSSGLTWKQIAAASGGISVEAVQQVIRRYAVATALVASET